MCDTKFRGWKRNNIQMYKTIIQPKTMVPILKFCSSPVMIYFPIFKTLHELRCAKNMQIILLISLSPIIRIKESIWYTCCNIFAFAFALKVSKNTFMLTWLSIHIIYEKIKKSLFVFCSLKKCNRDEYSSIRNLKTKWPNS